MKRQWILSLIIPSILLSGCSFFFQKDKANNSSDNNNESSSDSSIYINEQVELLFTELYIGEAYANRAVELYNISDNDIDMNGFYLNVYRSGGGKEAKPSESILLSGAIKAHETYVISYSKANEEILSKADFITDEFLNDGTFPMTITSLSGFIHDEIGYPGFFYDVANRADAVRKKESIVPGSYSPYDWIRYSTSHLDNLGNINCISNEILYDGPKLTQNDFNTPYTSDGNIGEGGAIEVKLSYTIDGDTTKFIFPSSLSSYGISGSNSVRYYGINTPEVAHGENPADPYGPEAREFTNRIINSSKHFVVQSVKGYSLTETYGRMLGYVWVTDKSSPNPDDYYLLNHFIVQNGYARIGHITRGDYNDYMTYEDISYVEYIYDAQQYAIKNKIHIYEGDY